MVLVGVPEALAIGVALGVAAGDSPLVVEASVATEAVSEVAIAMEDTVIEADLAAIGEVVVGSVVGSTVVVMAV